MLISQNGENARQNRFIPGSRIVFVSLPLLDVRNCCNLSLYAISRKTNGPKLRKWQITQFQGQFCPKFETKTSFSCVLSLLDIIRYCKLSMYSISKKTNKPNLRKWQKTYNYFHNILRLFDVLTNFPFTTSETMRDYYLQTWYIRVASRVAEQLKTQDLGKWGNIRKVSKPDRMLAQYQVFLQK